MNNNEYYMYPAGGGPPAPLSGSTSPDGNLHSAGMGTNPLVDRIGALETDVKDLFNMVKDEQAMNAELRAELENLKAMINQAVQRQSGKVGYWDPA